MTSYQRGSTATLTVQWLQFPGGPPVAVTNVQITITPLAGGPAVIGPTSVGVTNPATGLNAYQWAINPAQATGDYVVVWTGTDPQAQPVQASEVVTVVVAPSAGVYATVDDLTEHLKPTPIPANAQQLLVRASRDVDKALLCSVYDPADADVITALKTATLEQVAGNLTDGDRTGLGVSSPQQFTLGRLSVTRRQGASSAIRRVGVLCEQAWDVLQLAGLTGHEPQNRR